MKKLPSLIVFVSLFLPEWQKKFNTAIRVGNAIKAVLRQFNKSAVELARLLFSDFVSGGADAAVALIQQVQALPPKSRNTLHGLALNIYKQNHETSFTNNHINDPTEQLIKKLKP